MGISHSLRNDGKFAPEDKAYSLFNVDIVAWVVLVSKVLV